MTLTSVAELCWHMVDPRGRCNRKGLLIVAGLLLVAQIALGLVIWAGDAAIDGPVVFTLKLVFLWTAVCAGAKRLHDLNLRAWWMLGALGVATLTTVLLVVAMAVTFGLAAVQPGTTGYFVTLASLILPIFAATLWLHFRKGQNGQNRFGIEPRGMGFSGPVLNVQALTDLYQRLLQYVLPPAAHGWR